MTLYRTYRPATFGEIVGQEHITATLQNAITKQKVAHAYLFHGPRGTGKTTTARVLARRLNCQKPKGAEPCGTCPACRASIEGASLDVIEIDAASNRGIDDIRALKSSANLAAAGGKYRVYIIDEVHMLTPEAFTALLKTLEEPVPHVIFILATTELHKVPETILSRCQVFRFRRATNEELLARLQHILRKEQRRADDDTLAFIISRSDGCYRDAESLLGQLLTAHDDKKVTAAQISTLLGLPPRTLIDQLLAALVRADAQAAVTLIDDAFAQGFDPEQIVRESILTARDGSMALIKNESSTLAFTQEPNAAARLPLIIRTLIQAAQDLAFVPQPLIALQLAIVTLCPAPLNTDAARKTTPSESAPREFRARQQTQPAAAAATTSPSNSISPTASPAGRSLGAGWAKDETAATVELAAVTSAWPKVIEALRRTNPVAATFVRAMEPQSLEGTTLRIRAYYTLHRNFFEKKENQRLLTQALKVATGTALTPRIALEQNKQTIAARQQKSENELLATVKEVFGEEVPAKS